MKLVVLGANGRTGRLVVRGALAQGDHVTAVVRNDATRIEIQHDRLRVVVGDCCDPAFLARVFANQDAAISTLGGRSPTKRATSIYWRSADAIATAAWDTGLRNIAVTSTALLFPAEGLFDAVLAALVGNVVHSAQRMEDRLQKAQLNLAVGRCGFLTNHDDRSYRRALDMLPDAGRSIARLGLAQFLLDAVRETRTGMHIYGVAGPA